MCKLPCIYDRIIGLARQLKNYHIWKVACVFEGKMHLVSREKEWADRARRYVKAELKRAEVSYAELERRLKEHGLEETEASITAKLNRGTFAATFFLASMLAIGKEQVNLADV